MTFLHQLLGMASVNDERLWSTWAGPPSVTGMVVTPETALKVSTVWACVGLLADCVAMLPTIVYQRLADESRQRATNHPLYDLLHNQPNIHQTAFEFKNMMQGHLLLRGNAYAQIVPGARGPADQLIPLHPDRVTPETLPDGGLRYKIRQLDGTSRTFNDEDILHLKGLSMDGKTGLSIVAYARESLGLALAGEMSGARTFSNGSRPSGVLKMAGKLSKEGGKKLKDSWQDAQAGVGNTGKVAVLEEGLEWQAIGLNNRDTQWLESREFQAEDICRWFRVPPHMVALTSKATSWGSGIEQMGIGFVTYTLMPWLVRWQQAISRDLIIATQNYFVEFLVDALLRSDLKSRYDAYGIARNCGWMNVDEIRQRENMNPLPNGAGQIYLQPLNMSEPGGALAAPTAGPMVPTNSPLNDQRSGAEHAAGDNVYAARNVAPPPNSSAHYGQLLYEAAGRVVRKEIAAIRRAAKHGDFMPRVNEFYSTHAEFVAQSLRISLDVAEQYVAGQIEEIILAGVEGVDDWETRRVADLVNLALESK